MWVKYANEEEIYCKNSIKSKKVQHGVCFLFVFLLSSLNV